MLRLLTCLCLMSLSLPAAARGRLAILDMHLHAPAADEQGPPPLAMCTPMSPMPTWDQQRPWDEALVAYFKAPTCRDPIWSPTTGDEIMRRTLAILERRNIIGVVSDDAERVARYRAAAPRRVLTGLRPPRALLFDAAQLRPYVEEAKAEGRVDVIGELGLQYGGISPDDPRLEALWSTAEALDIPVALHMGPGPPGVGYLPNTGYRAKLGNPLLLEDVLVKHPKLRLQLMHAGYPMLDATLALLYAHPQVYVDTGVIVYTQPPAAFYRYLQALVDAGFGKRIMFGSDQMIWPEAIERSIKVIEDAPFLSAAQKRDILYDNAARFLRLDAATIAQHRGL